MRPGPIRPGDTTYWLIGEFRRATSEASMRPGPIRPGDLQVSARLESGHHVAMVGFNEARADSPGRVPRQVSCDGRGSPSRASMRPGPIRPGDGPCPKFLSSQSLQCHPRAVPPSEQPFPDSGFPDPSCQAANLLRQQPVTRDASAATVFPATGALAEPPAHTRHTIVACRFGDS